MLRITLKNLAARKLRLLTTGVAVLLGVAFMAGTLVLTATIGASFDSLFADAYKGTDAYVRGEVTLESSQFGDQRPRVNAALIERLAEIDGVRAVGGYVEAYAQLVGTDGKAIGNPRMGAPVVGGVWLTDDVLNPFDIAEGRAPTTSHEVVIDKHSAETGKLAVGDTVSVLTQAGTVRADLVGIATFVGNDSPGGASFTLFTPKGAETYLTEPGRVDAIRVAADPGVSQADLVARIKAVVPSGTEVLTGAEITHETQAEIRSEMGFLTVFLMAFALISLFVGSFIIYNSFSILVAQRTKEMALMRAIGARRRQVMSAVLIEALAVGLVASIGGIVAGVGIALGLKSLLSSMGIDFPGGGVVLGSSTIVISLVAGLVVSVASAVLPARRASKIAPLAAMRAVAVDDSGRGRGRIITGSAIAAIGTAAVAMGLFGGGGPAPVGLGALVVFIGVAVLGPVLARPVSRVLGAPVAARSVSGSLARENAMRSPKRTASTASALMIGVALVGFITIMGSSMKASLNKSVERSFSSDLVVESGAFDSGGLPTDLAATVAALPEVKAASSFRVVPASVDGTSTILTSVDPKTVEKVADLDVRDGALRNLGTDRIAISTDVAKDRGWAIGDKVTTNFAETGKHPLTVVAVFNETDLFGDYVISHQTYDNNVADRFDTKIALSLADGVDLEAGRVAVEKVTAGNPLADVQDRDEFRAARGANVDMLLHLIYALLALAVIIALLGITNTLLLSILERTRELGLLRAVGMTRAQLRATVRYESMIIALLGTAFGLTIGIGFGWAFVKAMSDVGVSTFSLPVGSLVLVAAIAAAAGVAAALLPARRAARLDVLEAITTT